MLPYVRDPDQATRVLLQLRDVNANIAFPGCWGFFGGAVAAGELPLSAAQRELTEEIGYTSDVFSFLDALVVPDLDDLKTHIYCCPLLVPVAELVQSEGMDLALVTLHDVLCERIYSDKLRKHFPVAATPFISDTFGKLLRHLQRIS